MMHSSTALENAAAIHFSISQNLPSRGGISQYPTHRVRLMILTESLEGMAPQLSKGLGPAPKLLLYTFLQHFSEELWRDRDHSDTFM
jgi:hypothetical protein